MKEVSKDKPIVGPSPQILETLKNAVFTGSYELKKPDGKTINTRLVESGAGMVGLEPVGENQEWAGIFNHSIKVTGASLAIARLLKLNGAEIDPQLVVDAVMLHHSGRRQYDEAIFYPENAPDANGKTSKDDGEITINNLRSNNLPDHLIETVSAVGYSFRAKTWEEKLPSYLDHRIAQNAMPLDKRFEDLQRGVTLGRYSQQFLDDLKTADLGIEHEVFDALHLSSYDMLATNPANLKARLDTAIKLGKFSKDEVDALRKTKLYKPKSGVEVDLATAAGLTEEQFLERLQLTPQDINDRFLAPELWERYIRRLYINDAEQGIFARLSKLHRDIDQGVGGSTEELDKEFPPNTWWGKYARELYGKRHGAPLIPRAHKQVGIARAINFYRELSKENID